MFKQPNVGLANVGKSTFFQAITRSKLGNPANYPFATIEPEEARVIVPCDRLSHLQHLYSSQKKVPATLKIFDIAGLVRGAATGEGLGNQFLSDIRAVDGIFQVVRGFQSDEITHIEGSVDPVRDLTIVQDELLLKDMEFAENSIERLQRQLKNRSGKSPQELKDIKEEVDTLTVALDYLMDGRRIASNKQWSDSQIEILNRNNFLTAKPCVFLLNTDLHDFESQSNDFLESVEEWVSLNSPGSETILFSAQNEWDLSEISDTESKSALPTIITAMRNALGLISYYTCGPLEARQWTVRENTLAPEAASVIHTDLRDTFINAEVIKYAEVADLQPPFDEKTLKSKGRVQRVGKAYVVEDGDIVHFKAAAGKNRK
ncbi:unnamed protein product [Kuraishia capsulata CBS 1993]|uniref:Obg-like ATPase homolog n=1 Tax=Kuraishia capsulata CBS 1993 TaxID=1382522 RepID=W6MKG1_9ASCO|nr:uncharacterized protein KUCA_T00002825001 [Kuraishia capsulata CBS 1993]CDK26851.1 unnamed protein product [Kuraishia capsulata CBS 1993]